ncbi:unnamed protein product [Cylindrotheca closterium]|uniref:Peptidase S54 rhomboid domain-containing protein n=1 Tax=Cylindrotheca closterium TaxID=2856 RepID=A0AAD2PV30_9STRA|nr:unnamed protein product [Cylindrotheca closterium]
MMLHNEDSNSQLPPPSNPILDRYLVFRNGTPFVTRLMLSSQVTCYILSFLVNTQKVAANIPYFTVYNFQLYRILLSPLLCNRFVSLVIAFFSFSEPGRRLEQSVGSTSFLCLVTTLATLTNVAYIIFAFLLCELTGKESFLYQQASGIWLVVFGIIAIECNRAPPQSTRRLLFFPVQVEYFPCALFAFFCFFTGTFEWSHILSIGIGYAYEHGYLESMKPASPRCRRWEEKGIYGLAESDGWVKLDQIIGSGAWCADSNDHITSQASNGGRLFSQVQRQYQKVSTNVFSTRGSGHVLGGVSRRTAQSTVDPRRARLQAIEKRMNEVSDQGCSEV